MRTQVKRVCTAPRMHMEYALAKSGNGKAEQQTSPEREKEKLREMVRGLVKEAVQKQLKEQQDYYKSRPSLAARQMEQMFGTGNLERMLTSAVSVRVYEQIEDHIRHEWIRKGR